MHKIMFSFFFPLLLGFTACDKSIDSSADLHAQLTKIAKKNTVPGFAVTVVKNDVIALQEAYGFANTEQQKAFTNKTTQPVGSVSKLMIGVALMKAIEQGHFTLDTDINILLPFAVKHPAFPDAPILIRHLVTHTSGIQDDEAIYLGSYSFLKGESLESKEAKTLMEQYGVKKDGQVAALADFMSAYLTPAGKLYKKTNFGTAKPGTNYNYSNIASALAAYIVEHKTGRSFREYTKKHIFEPLGMTSTAWTASDLTPGDAATLYWAKGHPLPAYTMTTYPDGALHICNEDLGKFLLEMMRGFQGKSAFMSAESFKAMFDKKLTPLPANMNPKEDNYGVFWVWFKNGRLGHTGGDFGLLSILAFTPGQNTGFLLLCNAEAENSDESEKVAAIVNDITKSIKAFEAAE
jgi:CubicO group peptidase (beta-lactamase class C family)